jgi:transposase InsO family protein
MALKWVTIVFAIFYLSMTPTAEAFSPPIHREITREGLGPTPNDSFLRPAVRHNINHQHAWMDDDKSFPVRSMQNEKQFTSGEFTQLLKNHGIAISMDGRGCWRDNVFVERLWKSIKYEEVYLRAYETVSEARSGIGRYLEFYNSRRPHSALDAKTPDAFYFANLSALELAA